MATLTITVDRLSEVQVGDRLVAIDGDVLAYKRVFIGGLRHVGPGESGPMGLPYEHPGVKAWLYPDSMVAHSITVERDDDAPEPAPAPKKPRKPVTRTVDGVRLIHRDGSWWTEDGRFEVRLGFDGYTECEADHPVRITRDLLDAARHAGSTNAWAAPILRANARGKRGYLCAAGTEHQNPPSWQVWDWRAGEYIEPGTIRYESFGQAASIVARFLRAQEA